MIFYEQDGTEYDVGTVKMEAVLKFIGTPSTSSYREGDDKYLIYRADNRDGWNQRWDGLCGRVVLMTDAERCEWRRYRSKCIREIFGPDICRGADSIRR